MSTGRQFAQQPHARRAFAHRPLEMRDAADDVDAQIQRALQVVEAAAAAQHPVLRERDQLQVEIGRHAPLHVQQRLHREQRRVAGVHVAADGQQAARDGPVAVGQGALRDVVGLQLRLELAPQRDAFQQRAALVDARPAVGQHRVHVEVRIAEGRREQPARGVQRLARGRDEARRDFADRAGLDGDRHAGTAVRQGGVGDQEVEHRRRVDRVVRVVIPGLNRDRLWWIERSWLVGSEHHFDGDSWEPGPP
jgi:hypothetical protein